MCLRVRQTGHANYCTNAQYRQLQNNYIVGLQRALQKRNVLLLGTLHAPITARAQQGKKWQKQQKQLTPQLRKKPSTATCKATCPATHAWLHFWRRKKRTTRKARKPQNRQNCAPQFWRRRRARKPRKATSRRVAQLALLGKFGRIAGRNTRQLAFGQQRHKRKPHCRTLTAALLARRLARAATGKPHKAQGPA